MFRYDRLEERIKATGKKKVYLCEKLQRAPTYLRDAKKQNTNIKGVDLQILADELNTTAEYLTGESDEKEKSPTPDGEGLTETQKKAWELIRNLDDEKLIAFLKMMGG